MARDRNPIIQGRRLRAELRHLRDELDLTQQQVADELEWSLSKLIRIETGVVGVTITDLRALLQTYRVTDQARIDELAALARASRQEAWWDKYRPYFGRRFLTYLGLEESATRIYAYQQLVIPGLLQTEDYARTVIAAYSEDVDLDRLNRSVRARMERQQLLTEADGPKMAFIVDEAAIRRWVGGSEVMRPQLNQLKELNRLRNVSIRVVPFSRGAHAGVRGSFTVLELESDDNNDYAVDIEQARTSELIQNDPEEAVKFLETFSELEKVASPSSELDTMIDRVLAEYIDEDSPTG